MGWLQRMFRFFSVLFAVLVMPFVAHAEIECKSQPVGQVNVVWGSDEIKYDFKKSQSQMDRIKSDTVNPYHRSVKTHVGGLMQGGIAIKSGIQIATLSYPRAKKICQWVGNMQVSLNISPKILISREHKKGTCKHKAILEHEMKHVFVDREVVKKYVPIIRANMLAAVKKVGIVGPKNARDEKKFHEKITKYMEDQLKIVSDQMYAERSKRQQGVDTLEEYERVARVCG